MMTVQFQMHKTFSFGREVALITQKALCFLVHLDETPQVFWTRIFARMVSGVVEVMEVRGLPGFRFSSVEAC